MAVLFDTRAYHRTLTNAGLPAGVADAHTEALEAALKGGVATKEDIASVRQDLREAVCLLQLDGALLRQDFAALRSDTRQNFAGVRLEMQVVSRDLKIWTGGVAAALAGFIVGAIKLL